MTNTMNQAKHTIIRGILRGNLALLPALALAAFLAPVQTHAAPPPGWLLAGATATADSEWPDANKKFSAAKAIDGDNATRWASKANIATLEITLAKPATADTLVMREYGEGGQFRVTQFTVEYSDGKDWKPLLNGSTIGRELRLPFKPVKINRLRLKINGTTSPSLWEVQLLDSKKPATKS